MLHSAFTSITSWMMDDCLEEEGDYKFYCNSPKLIETIVEKATECDNCVDIEQKVEDAELAMSPRHKKLPSPSLMKSSRIQPCVADDENVLTEKLLRDRAQSGELGVRVGDGVLSLELLPDGMEMEGQELLLMKVEDASAATLRTLSQIPEYCSTILAICFDFTKDDLDKLENALRGPAFSWKIGKPIEEGSECKLSDSDFEAFVAIARATVVLHVIQAAGF
jgi:hypothetical protein